MPFVKYIVTPVYVRRRSLDENVCGEFDEVTNNTLVELLKQLTCLVRLADTIFGDIFSEFEVVNHRSDEVKKRIQNVSDVVDNLDAKSEKIPEGDIESFVRTTKHYRTEYNAEESSRDLLVSGNRPECIRKLYVAASETPVSIIDNEYRIDGIAYLLTIDKRSSTVPDLEIETRKPAILNDNDESSCSGSKTSSNSPSLLPSPEQRVKATADDYPATLVPIDVTGSSFQRMSTFRRSLLQITFLDKRKKKKRSKRRNTICEGSLRIKKQDALTQTETSSNKSVKRRSFGLFNLRRKSADILDSNADIFRQGTIKKSCEKISISCQTDDELLTGQSTSKMTKNVSVPNLKEDKPKRKFLEGFTKSGKITSDKKKGATNIPISTSSQAMTVAVKLRGKENGCTRVAGKTKDDDRRSSSGNWSASSSTRTSIDSDTTNKTSTEIPVSSLTASQSSRDSATSDKENPETSQCSQDDTLTGGYNSDSTAAGSMSTRSFAFRSPIRSDFKAGQTNVWLQSHSKIYSNVSDQTTSDAESTPLVLSPLSQRRNANQNNLTDDESSVYSVDTDGYYTSMHTDSGLRAGVLPSPPPLPAPSSNQPDAASISPESDATFTNSDTICVRGRSKTPPPPPPRTCSSRPTSMVEPMPEQLSLELKSKLLDLGKRCELDRNLIPKPRSNSSSDGTECSASNGESDAEALDRIRNKTVITSRRYPSMVVVSESEDDESRSSTTCSTPSVVRYVRIPNVEESPATTVSKMSHCSPIDKSTGGFEMSKSDIQPVDIKNLSYPVVSSTGSTTLNTGMHQRPTTLNLKNTCVSEHDVPMLRRQYSLGKSPLYCDSIIKNKPAGLQRSQSVKHDDRSPVTPKRHPGRVAVIPDGQVVYNSSSLGRRRNRIPMMNIDSTLAKQIPLSHKYSTLPNKLKCDSGMSSETNPSDGRPFFSSYSLDRRSLRNKSKAKETKSHVRFSNASNAEIRRPPPPPVFSPKYPPNSEFKTKFRNQPSSASRQPPEVPSKPSSRRKANGFASSDATVIMNPLDSRNTCGLPVPPSSAALRNASKPYRVPQQSSTSASSSSANSQQSSPERADSSKVKKSTMTLDDLYTAIHNSKKKMNISTDPNYLSPRSSRSNSPGVVAYSNPNSRSATPNCVSPTPSVQSNASCPNFPTRKNGSSNVVETGFLQSRNFRNVAGERSSWAAGGGGGGRSSPSPDVHSSAAASKSRNSKPTSMNDFKRLLLQTKSSSLRQRSAAEILNANSPVNRQQSPIPTAISSSHFRPISTSPQYVVPSPAYNSPKTSNGRSLSPFKRNNRLRTSLPVGSIIRSPIWEDNLESETATNDSHVKSLPQKYGYLARDSSNQQSSRNNPEMVLHIPTRSAVESSV